MLVSLHLQFFYDTVLLTYPEKAVKCYNENAAILILGPTLRGPFVIGQFWLEIDLFADIY